MMKRLGTATHRLIAMATVLLVAVSAFGSAAQAQDKIALIIGNANYSTVSALDNPARDATLMAETLETIGFDVTLLINATQIEMNTALGDFGRSLRNSGPETTGLFYYAGHGVQSFGNNYLLPVDVSLQDAADLDLQGVEAQTVLRQMASARNRTNFVILDACRNNPFEDIPDFNDAGLAEMKAPTGTFLSYATAPGSVALDGIGENSPFTLALAKEMLTPGIAVEQMFKRVRVSVLDQTMGMQTPWDTSSLTSDFKFVDAPEEDPEALAERKLWESVQATRDPVQIMLFLRGYPDSEFADDARGLLTAVIEKELTNPAPEPQQPVAAGPSAEEQKMFDAVQANPTIEGYQDFVAAFPDGTYTEFAKGEIAALQANTNFDPVGEGVTEEQPDIETAALAERQAIIPSVVKYDVPLVAPGSIVDGLLLSQINTLSPQFPPIPELPEEFWKGQSCSNCHEWTRDRLCDQSNVYLNLSAQRSLEKAHPFNGDLKRNLKQWAAGGCQ